MKTTIALLIATLSWNAFAANADLVSETRSADKRTLLADSFQKTLYVFDPDQGTGSSVCAGDCAEVWPPYVVNAKEAKDLQAPLGTVARANGKLQLTFNVRPVYTYIFDRNAGEDRGDGLGNVWHVVELN